MSSTTKPLTVLITGANRGIGLCILQRLLAAFPQHRYLLGTRDVSAGNTTLVELEVNGSYSPTENHVEILPLDLSSTSSIISAVEHISGTYDGKLDVLVNNAGVAVPPPNDSARDLSGLHASWATTFATNVFAPHLLFTAFLPLLIASPAPRVINMSSGRASLGRSSTGKLPPTAIVSYSVSKVALNGLGVEMEKVLARDSDDRGRVWAVNPGHCKTAFNGFKGKRDPMEGAGVVLELLRKDYEGRPVESGFWEEEGGVLTCVPW